MSNDKERETMRTFIAAAIDKGWTLSALSVYLGLSSSTLSAYAAGKSMGTNDLRSKLAKLGYPRQHKDAIEWTIAALAKEAHASNDPDEVIEIASRAAALEGVLMEE